MASNSNEYHINNNNNNNNNNNDNTLELEKSNTVNDMTNRSLNYFKVALQQTSYLSENTSDVENDIGITLIIIEAITDILKTRSNELLSLYQTCHWNIFIPVDLIKDFIIIFRDMSFVYVQRHFLDPENSSESRDDDSHVSVFSS